MKLHLNLWIKKRTLGDSEMMAKDVVGGILKHPCSLGANSFGPQCVCYGPMQIIYSSRSSERHYYEHLTEQESDCQRG